MAKKVTIELLSNVRARLTGAPKSVLTMLDNALAEQQKGAEWSPNHRRFGGRWDGKKHHFCISPTTSGAGTFPKGLVARVRTLLATAKVKAKTVDLRKNVHLPVDLKVVTPHMLKGVAMVGKYSYQLDAVKAALKQEAGVLFMATNAGKTEIGTAIIKALADRTILFVVPKAILLKQTRERIAERLGTIPETIGVIGGGKFDPKEITVAIINSVTPAKHAKSPRSRAKNEILRAYLKTIDAVFLDEGHHAKATTWFRLMTALVNAQHRYLMSGTPFTGDNDLMIEAAAGPVIYEIRNEALIALGVSAKPKVRLIAIAKPDLERKDSLDDESWDAISKAGIIHNVYRNNIIAKEAAAYSKAGKSVIVLIRILAQGSEIRSMIAKLKAPVQFAHGKMPESEQDKIVDWYTAKPGRILVGSAIFDEGVDMPSINALIIGDGGKSLRAVLQKVGRSVRAKKTGANVVDVVDFSDLTHHWLAKHSLERLDIYTGENFDVVEEDPEQTQEQTQDGRRRIAAGGEEALQALSREADRGGDVHGNGELQFRAVGVAIGRSADELQESSLVMLWRWRQAT